MERLFGGLQVVVVVVPAVAFELVAGVGLVVNWPTLHDARHLQTQVVIYTPILLGGFTFT